MSPQTEPWLLSSEEPEEELAGTADELEERIDTLEDHIEDAREGLRARREDADEVEVTKGLKGGEPVVLTGTNRLATGVPVEVAEAPATQPAGTAAEARAVR